MLKEFEIGSALRVTIEKKKQQKQDLAHLLSKLTLLLKLKVKQREVYPFLGINTIHLELYCFTQNI